MLIASRVLTLQDRSDKIRIPIRIFAPEESQNGSWLCRYEIDWPGEEHKMEIGGFDSAQALVLALQTIGAEIYSSNYHRSGKLYLDKPGAGYGFPVVPTLRDLLQGDDAKYL
jgi:Domain of unknown function (DUF6968)